MGKITGPRPAPEVRTLRVKAKTLADQNPGLFMEFLSFGKEWMAEAPQEAAVLYVDGHVRVYSQIPASSGLPLLVAHERLCLKARRLITGSTPWTASHFLCEPGRRSSPLQVAECDIVPRLENDVPNQPSSDQLEAIRCFIVFTVVFDREGYSPNFLFLQE